MFDQDSWLPPKAASVIRTLRPILTAAGQPMPDMRRISITQNSIVEFSDYDGLTKVILEYDMPEILENTTLDHYTTSLGFRGIMASQELHLAPVTYRLNQGELATFAQEHGLRGYVETDGTPLPLLAEAAADLFYASFTEQSPSEDLWHLFGERGNGYRLRFEVQSCAAQLRRIRYSTGDTLLKQINDALDRASLPKFILRGVSRVGAFYLPMTLKTENETRLLAKRFTGGGAPVVTSGSKEYWPVPIGSRNRTAQLELVEIGVRKLKASVVQSRLPSWCAGVSIVNDD